LKMFIDIGYRGNIDDSSIARLNELRYGIVAVEGISEVRRLGQVILIPRCTQAPGHLKESDERNGKKVVKIFRVTSQEEVKVRPALRSFHGIEISGHCVERLSIKAVKKLAKLKIPLLLDMASVLSNFIKGRRLRGVLNLLKEFQKGELDIGVVSGATSLSEALHPIIYEALLIDLGVTEDKAYEAVYVEPKRIIRRVGYEL
jgi:hypothetical protein